MPAAVAYAALALCLLGWGAFSHQKVQVLSAQVEAKDETIRLLRSTAAATVREPALDGPAPVMPPAMQLPGPLMGDGGLRPVSYGTDPYGTDAPGDAYGAGQAQGYYNLVH